VLILCLALYAATTQSGPAWQDSGIFQWRILHFDLMGWKGLALAHPLLIVAGKLLGFLPFGSLAWRMNLVSAVAAAVAVANIAMLVRRLVPRCPVAAWIAGGVFATAHTVWWLGTICESQALHAALFTASLHVLVSVVRTPRVRLAVILGAINGLALTAHNMALLALPAYGLMVIYLCARRGLSWVAVPGMIAGWLVGASGYLVLVVGEAARHGLGPAVNSALFGTSWRADVLGGSWAAVRWGLVYVLYNLPNLALPLAVLGLLSMVRTIRSPVAVPDVPGRDGDRSSAALSWAMGYLVLIYFIFAVRYPVADQFMFFLPFYAMVAILAGLGLSAACEGGRRRWLAVLAGATLVVGPILYAAAPALCRALDYDIPGRKDLPYRDLGRYWLVPSKVGEDSAGRFAREALREAPPGSIIIADGTSYYPLRWVQLTESVGAGVRVVQKDDREARAITIQTPNVFVTSDLRGYHPGWVDREAALSRGAVLFRVHPRAAPTLPSSAPGN
jgi:hypothetical protein